MESLWDTQKNAPMYLLAIPDPRITNGTAVEIGPIPGAA